MPATLLESARTKIEAITGDGVAGRVRHQAEPLRDLRRGRHAAGRRGVRGVALAEVEAAAGVRDRVGVHGEAGVLTARGGAEGAAVVRARGRVVAARVGRHRPAVPEIPRHGVGGDRQVAIRDDVGGLPTVDGRARVDGVGGRRGLRGQRVVGVGLRLALAPAGRARHRLGVRARVADRAVVHRAGVVEADLHHVVAGARRLVGRMRRRDTTRLCEDECQRERAGPLETSVSHEVLRFLSSVEVSDTREKTPDTRNVL